jgi:NitT/TauT family transport system substrate-binding protein
MRPPVFILLVAWFALGAGGLGLSGCSPQPVAIEVAYSPFEPTALVWLAQDRQFFIKNGLFVTFDKYDTGPAALDAMLSGEADLAVGIGEFPIVSRALKQTKARILTILDRSELIGIVARKDRGITRVADLRGKRVGTTRGTISEFFLGRFLEINGMSIGDVTLVDLKTPKEWVDAVAEGDVDAVATAEPYVTSARERLGPNAVTWSAHSGQPMYGLVAGANEWLAAHAEIAKRFLRALAEAEDYAVQNPIEAQAIVQKTLGLAPASMQAVWERNQFSLALDQSLIAAMEDEARWLIGRDITAGTTLPDFLDYVWEDGLEDVRPEAVDIIRSSAQ